MPVRGVAIIVRRLLVPVVCLFLTILLAKLTVRAMSARLQAATYSDVVEISELPRANLQALTHAPVVSESFELFNESCQVDYLGVPEQLNKLCPKHAAPFACKFLTCRNLLSMNNDEQFYSYAREFMTKHPQHALTDKEMIALTANCSSYLHERGYKKKEGITEDLDFSIAFNILAHRNIEQIERLIYALYRPQHQICIHIDRKHFIGMFKAAIEGIARCLSSNVFIASKLEHIMYGGHSRLRADINCMDDHVRRGKPWKYIVNTAAEAFPLRSQKEMINILRLYNGTNDIEGIYGKHIKARRFLFEDEYLELLDKPEVFKTGRKNPPPPHDIDIVKGSAYGAFSRGFVQFVLNDVRAKDFLKWSNTTFSPDEIYWATLHHLFINPHLNTPGGYRGFPSQTHFTAVYANWGFPRCKGKVVHYICINGVEDLPHLLTRRELFVNKFHADFEPLALHCMRAWIEHKEFCPVQYDYEFYKQLASRDVIE